MHFFNKLLELATQRVETHGAQYRAFAIFGLINYPLILIYEIYTVSIIDTSNVISYALILTSTILCFVLLLKNHWLYHLQQFLPLYWYVTITISIPTLVTYMLFKNSFSLPSLMNANIGAMIMILLLDYVTLIVIGSIGIIFGISIFHIFLGLNYSLPKYDDLLLSLYIFFYIIVLGSFFSRNKAKDEALLDLNKALLDKTVFFNNMTHEIRSSVHGISGISGGLVEHWNECDNQQKLEYAEKIARNARRLYSLLCDLLDLSKFSAGQMLLKFVKITDFNIIVDDIIEECNTMHLHEKIMTIQFTRLKPITIIADKERIAQVIRNLCTNAIKFSAAHGIITLQLTKSEIINNSEKQEAIHFCITDRGIGVPEKDLGAIFNPFVQSSRTAAQCNTGTGLGLSICKEIIEKHGGKIWAENNKGMTGATFNFIIPLTQATISISSIHDNQLTKTETDNYVVNKKSTLLVIDDEEICVANMKLMLANKHYNVIGVNSGHDALEYLYANSSTVDIVMLDLMIPDMRGLDILAAIKASPALAKIPIILQTGASSDIEIKQAYEIGITQHVRKPYTKDEIMPILQRLV